MARKNSSLLEKLNNIKRELLYFDGRVLSVCLYLCENGICVQRIDRGI